MATATPNILIKSIHGRIGNIVFYYSRGKQCVRTHVIPRNPDTEAQRAVRRSFGDAVRTWQSMSTDERSAFTKKARFLNMSGYNLYISKYIKTKISGTKSANSAAISPDSSQFALYPDLITSVSKPYIKAFPLYYLFFYFYSTLSEHFT